MDWGTLLTALALVLVIEGMMPFLDPGGWRRLMKRLQELEDRQLRYGGAAVMLGGVALLYIVH